MSLNILIAFSGFRNVYSFLSVILLWLQTGLHKQTDHSHHVQQATHVEGVVIFLGDVIDPACKREVKGLA